MLQTSIFKQRNLFFHFYNVILCKFSWKWPKKNIVTIKKIDQTYFMNPLTIFLGILYEESSKAKIKRQSICEVL